MSAITVFQVTGSDVVDGVEHGHEHGVYRLSAQQLVSLGDTDIRAVSLQSDGSDEGPADSHEDGSRHALSAHISHDNANVLVVNAEEVVEVASHILGRVHQRCQVELMLILGEGREYPGQDSLLYLTSHSQVGLQRLQLVVLFL